MFGLLLEMIINDPCDLLFALLLFQDGTGEFFPIHYFAALEVFESLWAFATVGYVRDAVDRTLAVLNVFF
jgi:hypothetical protein